jgi:hypothetical protein
VDRRSDNATAVDVEIDPYCRRLGRSQTDFAFQAIVECRAAKAKRVAVLLRWHADGGEVRRGLAVGRCRAPPSSRDRSKFFPERISFYRLFSGKRFPTVNRVRP